MPEDTEQEVVAEVEVSDNERPPSAETKNTEKKPAERMIPKSRLDDEIARRNKAEQELEKFRKADDDRRKAEMTELDRLKLEKTEADKRAEKAEGEARELKLQIAFEDAAAELEVVFASKQAAKDAYKFLDPNVVKDDGSGMQKALEALKSERPYLFAETAEDDEQSTDARLKGTRRGTRDALDKERERELRTRFLMRRPR